MAARIAVLAGDFHRAAADCRGPDELAGYRYVGMAFGGLIMLSGLGGIRDARRMRLAWRSSRRP